MYVYNIVSVKSSSAENHKSYIPSVQKIEPNLYAFIIAFIMFETIEIVYEQLEKQDVEPLSKPDLDTSPLLASQWAFFFVTMAGVGLLWGYFTFSA
jgi:hypothetical protein